MKQLFFRKFQKRINLETQFLKKKNEFEQQIRQFVLKLLFLVETIVSFWKSAHARRPPWEPLDMFIGSCFDVWGPFFRSHFRKRFFLKNDAKWSPKLPPKVKKTLSKTTLEMKSKKHAQNVLKLMPRDLWKTSFRMEGLYKITKTRGANNCKNMSKNDVKISQKSMKNGPWSSTKNHA